MTLHTRSTLPEEAAKEGLLAVVIERAVVAARAAASVVDRWTSAVRGVVTPLGWGAVGGAVVALILGYGWGWTELVTIGWGLALLVAFASAWLAGRGAGSIELTLPVDRVAVGEAAAETLVVTENATVQVEAEATHIPEQFEVDVTDAEAGTQFLAGALALPSGTTLLTDAENQNLRPVLVCSPQLRPAVRRLIRPSLHQLPVLSYNELIGAEQVRSVGVVSGEVRMAVTS